MYIYPVMDLKMIHRQHIYLKSNKKNILARDGLTNDA